MNGTSTRLGHCGSHQIRLATERFGSKFAPLDRGTVADVVALQGRQAREVVVGGRPVVTDGALLTALLDQIRAHADQQARGLCKRMGAIK